MIRRTQVFGLIILWCHIHLSGVALGDDPIEALRTWVKKDNASRSELGKQAFASQSLTKKQATQATEILLADFKAKLREERKEEWNNKLIQIGDLKMKFEFRTFGQKPKGGRSLYLSMHGGGGAPARVNESQWRNQIRLYQLEEGVYLAPRAPTDTWNLWHQSHIDQFFQRIIENAIVFEDVDPNRVYIMGYSAGGDGVYQLAPRMADSLAAAAMMAGHPNDASPLGLRNIGFTLHMGGKDAAYKRNEIARKWKKWLAELKKDDPEGYDHKVVIHEKYGHWMNGEDRVAIPWMARFSRNPAPDKIVWRQSSTRHQRFYWLAVDKQKVPAGSEVVVQRNGQQIQFTKMEKVSEVRIRLNDQLCDLDQKITVITPEGKKESARVERRINVIHQCLSERFDPAAIYTAEWTLKFSPESE